MKEKYDKVPLLPLTKDSVSDKDSVSVTIPSAASNHLNEYTLVPNSSPDRRWTNNSRLSFTDTSDQITLTWDNINVYAPPPEKKTCSFLSDNSVAPVHGKQILHNVTGVVEPGSSLAIMGASGAGKTTLLNVLTYRNRGKLHVEGDIRVNGCQVTKRLSSMSAYVQQDNLLIGHLTVREHLWFQSQLRMDKNTSNEAKAERVKFVMKEMGLESCADVFIGVPGKVKGISGGEKKRLTFGSEILTNPPLLFCDEPTTGLDSFMAQNVVQTINKMASRGNTILCTIHQPSSEVFALFDRVLLMAPGGRMAYLGPSKDALTFFKDCGYSCPTNYNPADHYIQILAKVPGREEESLKRINAICDSYQQTEQVEVVRDTVNRINKTKNIDFGDGDFSISPYKQSWFTQFYAVLWRSWVSSLRNFIVLKTKTYTKLFIAVILAALFWGQGRDLTQQTLTSINGMIYVMQFQVFFTYAFTTQTVFTSEFPIFLKEHFDGMYRVDVYFLSKVIAGIPECLAVPTVFLTIIYWSAGLNATAQGYFACILVVILVCNFATTFGYAMSILIMDFNISMSLSSCIIVPLAAIGGVFIKSSSVPSYFLWLKAISPMTYSNGIIMTEQWKSVTSIACPTQIQGTSSLSMANTTYSPTTSVPAIDNCLATGQEVLDSEGFPNVNIAVNYICLIALIVILLIVGFLALLLRSRQNFKMSKKRR